MNNSSSAVVSSPPSGEMLMSGVATFIFGTTALLVNALTLAAIKKRPSLRTPCFALIAAEAVFNWVVGFGFMNEGILRIGTYAGGLGNRYSRISCALMSMPKLVSGSVSILSCMISVDRLIGISMPFRYKFYGFRIAFYGILASIVVALLNLLVAGVTLPTPIIAVITCSTFISAFHPTYASCYKIIGLVFNCVLVVTYLTAAIVIFRRKAKIGSIAAATSNQVLRAQLVLIPVIKTMIAVNIVFGCFTDLASLTFSNYANGVYLPRASFYIGSFKAVSTVSDFFILLMMSNEFRSTLGAIVRREPVQQSSVKVISVRGSRDVQNFG